MTKLHRHMCRRPQRFSKDWEAILRITLETLEGMRRLAVINRESISSQESAVLKATTLFLTMLVEKTLATR